MFRQKITILLSIILISSTLLANGEPNNLILGGTYLQERKIESEIKVDNEEETYSLERFFRPSNMPILNTKRNLLNIDDYNKNPSDININKDLLKTPQDTIINYFSVLREAANPLEDTKTGCGSLGDTKGPYPYAYNFLSKSYKDKITYQQYLDSFKNQLHINLIKLNEVPPNQNSDDIKYFVELEVIEGTDKPKGVFAYYYGYIYLEKEDDLYKIKKMEYSPENYLCAPYHSWNWDAKSVVEIEYGEWCSLIDGETVLIKDGYERKVYFKDKNKNEYYVLFYELTNGVDIKIADYKKNKDGKWELIYINPSKCLKNKYK
ncbi:MAG: hypothetical protein IJH34_04250 [Romboutsia sp.]|nr:hypothetical protein [Romboutsia sp.]